MATKELIGIVVSDKLINTRVVAVDSKTTHKIYKKVMTRTKRYVAHDETLNAQLGDKVQIRETRPLSKTKNWVVINILEKSST